MHCGSDCVAEYSPSTKRHRLRANYCGDRFCVPCARARSKRIERALVERCKGKPPLFITLTMRANDDSLSKCLDNLLASFRRLRQQKLWRSTVKGGVAVTEIKKGSGSQKWHVHLHIIADSPFLDARKLSDGWRVASGGSFIVDVSRVRHQTEGIGYVAKYAGKGWTTEVVRDHDALVECVVSLRGRRLLCCFGSWSKLSDDVDGPDPGDWKRIDTLVRIVGAYERGEAWARAVMRSLGCDVEEKSTAPPAADRASEA